MVAAITVTNSLFGIAGAATGFLIPSAAQKFAEFKSAKLGKDLPADLRYTSLLLKLLLCLGSAAVWGFAASGSTTIISSLLISILVSLGILITLIDIRIHIIPNELVLAVIITGIAFQISQFGLSALVPAVISMLALMIGFTAVAGLLGFGKVGAGDVKLAGALGIVLGYPNIITALLFMAASLIAYCAIGLLSRKLTTKSMLPFAPFMMFGMISSLAAILVSL